MNPIGTDITLTETGQHFTYEYLSETSFKLTLTTGGALLIDGANLPSTVFGVGYSTAPPVGFSMHTPFVYGNRDSSVAVLDDMQLYGVQVPGFNPNIHEYTMTIPYILLESTYPPSALRALLSQNTKDILINPTAGGEVFVEVEAEDGTSLHYMVNLIPDNLTLGGIAINDKVMTSFDPFATSYTYTFTDVFTAAPTLIVNHAASVTETMTVAPHSSLANTYVYTVVLTKDGTSKTYTITVTGGASSNSGTTDRGDYSSGGGSGSGAYAPIPGGGTIPTPADIAKFLDPARELTNYILPPDLTNLANMETSLNFVKDAMNSVINEQQAINTLSSLDSLMKQINTSVSTKPTELAQVTQLMTNLTTGTEAKMALITNPEQQLAVLDKMMVEVQQFKLKVSAPTPELDKSVQELVQKTANNFGTLKITAPVTAEPVKIDNANLAALIAKQSEAITKLNELQKAYFENGSAKDIKQELKIVAQTLYGIRCFEN